MAGWQQNHGPWRSPVQVAAGDPLLPVAAEEGSLSGGPGLGDLGDDAGFRPDIHMDPQAEPPRKGEQSAHEGVVLGSLAQPSSAR
jgi:hypothetical protein